MGRIRSWWLHYLPGRGKGWKHETDEIVDEMEYLIERDDVVWTCNEFAKPGDYALLYVKSPISAITAIMQVASNSRRATKEEEADYWGKWLCDVKFLHAIDPPHTFHQMRDDGELRKAWSLVPSQMQSGVQSPPIVLGILNLLSGRIPTLAEFLGEEKEERKLEEEKSTEQWGVFTSAGKLLGRYRTKSDAQKQKTSDSITVMRIRPGSEFYKE